MADEKIVPTTRSGELFSQDGTDVWRVMTMYAKPTAVLKNLETGQEVTVQVGSTQASAFSKLGIMKREDRVARDAEPSR